MAELTTEERVAALEQAVQYLAWRLSQVWVRANIDGKPDPELQRMGNPLDPTIDPRQ